MGHHSPLPVTLGGAGDICLQPACFACLSPGPYGSIVYTFLFASLSLRLPFFVSLHLPSTFISISHLSVAASTLGHGSGELAEIVGPPAKAPYRLSSLPPVSPGQGLHLHPLP